MRTSQLSSIIALAALPLIGCAQSFVVDPDTAVGVTTTTGAIVATKFDDPQIAEILRTAFTVAVEESSLSAPFTPDANVAEYGMLMREQYGLALDGERMLIEENHLATEPSPMSRHIKVESQKAVPHMLGRSGSDFEQAFLAREIASQENLLRVIDDKLLPSVRNDAQRRELLELRPVVARLVVEATALHTWVLAHPSMARTSTDVASVP